MKKLGLLCLCALLALCCGCGGAREESAATPDADAQIRLEYWEVQWGGESNAAYSETLAALIREYCAANPGVSVQVTQIPQEKVYERFLAASVAGTLPDLCSCPMAQPLYFASQAQALDLSPILAQWREEDSPLPEELGANYFDIYTYGSMLSAIPFGLDCRVLYYREDYFERAGIDKLPNTVGEFSEVFATLREAYPDAQPLLFSADTKASATASSLFFLSMNGANAETTALDAVISERNAVSSYRTLAEWIGAGYISQLPLTSSDEDVRRSFLAGEACMVLTEPIASWLNESDLYGVCGVMNSPAGPYAIRGYTYYSPVCYQGFAQTEQPDEVRALIRWLAENNLPLFAEGRSCVLPLRASYAEALGEADKNVAEICEMIRRHGRMSNYPHTVIYPFQYTLQQEGILGDPLADVLGGGDVLEALGKAHTEYQKILENSGY